MIKPNDCLFLIIDIQEKLVKMLKDSNVKENAVILSKACDILNVNTIITEQYPKGLGETVKEIKDSSSKAKYFEKTAFSALKSEEIFNAIKASGKKQIIICGIEAHICVLQTALDLLASGYEVYYVKNCSGSRNSYDIETAEELLKQEGVKVVTTEIVLFSLLESSKHPNFKEVQALIK